MSASLGSTVKDFHEAEVRRPTPWLRIDPFLFIAAIGLIACSVYVVGNATQDDIPGNPHYYLVRQLAYGIVGILFMVVLARVDYSRMREWRWGIYATMVGLIGCSVFVVGNATQDDIAGNPNYYLVRQLAYGIAGILFMIVLARVDYSRFREWRWGIYGTMIGLILLVFAIGAAAKGSQRWIPLPFFNLQSSELGKLLLVVALSGFMVERLRKLGDKETTCRILLAAIFPAMLVIAQPDLG